MPENTEDDFRQIKILALTAIFIDDELLDKLVLKGGNAVDLIYNLAKRASLDLDLSLGGGLSQEEAEDFKERIKNTIYSHFQDNGYQVIDWKVLERPSGDTEGAPSFWGGYQIEFKIVTAEVYETYKDKPGRLSSNAISISPTNQKKIKLDVSKFEYTGQNAKTLRELDGYQIYVFTPLTLAFGKLRALCQQTKEYGEQVGRTPSPRPRARDFFDIYHLLESDLIDKTEICSEENLSILKSIFSCKKVGFELLDVIPDYRDLHENNFSSLEDTVYESTEMESFDFYFDYLIKWIETLKSCIEKAGIK